MLAHFVVSDDVERSRRFCTEVLGGRVVYSGPGGLTYVALSNSWIIIDGGGGPTDDKPAVTLKTPSDPDRVSSFLNIRVKDIEAVYAEWSARGDCRAVLEEPGIWKLGCYLGLFCRRLLRADVIIGDGLSENKGRKVYF